MSDYRKRRTRIVVAAGLLLALAGCTGPHKDAGWEAAVIPPAELPAGWALLPSSEMPLNCKMPWWTENPQVLRVPFPEELVLTTDMELEATVFYAAAYVKGDQGGVVMFALSYDSDHKAERAYQHLYQSCQPNESQRLGVSRRDRNTIALMLPEPDTPDREFFVKRFERLTRPDR
jgi:hypothetical protein